VLLGLGWFSYKKTDDYFARQRAAKQHRFALVTAQAWMATANYRADSTRYLAYRDSLLAVSGLDANQIRELPVEFEKEPERYQEFATEVARLVDSLYRIADSTRKKRELDSAEVDESDTLADSAQ